MQAKVETVQASPIETIAPAQSPIVNQAQTTTPMPQAEREERDIFTSRITAKLASDNVNVETEEVRSDFDRFMNDRNSYGVAQSTNEEVLGNINHNTNPNEESKQPSRLIQSIRDAANRYENASRPQMSTHQSSAPRVESESSHRAKSIAEKLGFINFDEDEFDTPSYLRKEEKTELTRSSARDFKNIDL